jgi:hypothetical protein
MSDVVVTADQNIEFQQNLSTLPIAVVILVADTNRIESLERLVPELLRVLESLPPKTLLRIGAISTSPNELRAAATWSQETVGASAPFGVRPRVVADLLPLKFLRTSRRHLPTQKVQAFRLEFHSDLGTLHLPAAVSRGTVTARRD